MLNGVFRDEIDDRDRPRLMFAPGSGDALLELRGIPRQVAIDDDIGVLKIQAGRARVGAQKNAAFGVILEGINFRAATLLRHGTGVPGKTDSELVAEVAHEFEHAFPFGKNDHFYAVVVAAFLEDFFQFCELRACAIRSSESRM